MRLLQAIFRISFDLIRISILCTCFSFTFLTLGGLQIRHFVDFKLTFLKQPVIFSRKSSFFAFSFVLTALFQSFLQKNTDFNALFLLQSTFFSCLAYILTGFLIKIYSKPTSLHFFTFISIPLFTFEGIYLCYLILLGMVLIIKKKIGQFAQSSIFFKY